MPTEIAAVTLTGAQTALYISSTEVAMTKTDIQLGAKKEDVTGSTSVSSNKVWDEFNEGSSGGSINYNAHWRAGASITPPDIRQGATYYFQAYTRRPAWNNAADQGSFYGGNVFVENISLSLEPQSGTIQYSVSGTWNGPVSLPG